jgi:hypothetical protein
MKATMDNIQRRTRVLRISNIFRIAVPFCSLVRGPLNLAQVDSLFHHLIERRKLRALCYPFVKRSILGLCLKNDPMLKPIF